MLTTTAVDATVEGFPTLSLPKQSGKLDYATIKETHQLLTVNAEYIECDLDGGQNGYLHLILPPKK